MVNYFNANAANIKNKEEALKALKSEYLNLRLHKSRLKLGAVKFTVREVRYNSILLFSRFEMVFKDQSATSTGMSAVESALRPNTWKWDFTNVIALLIIVSSGGLFLREWFLSTLDNYFPGLLTPTSDAEVELLRFSLNMINSLNNTALADLLSLISEIASHFSFLI